jgi:DNA-binding IclR family transcriptional regulator
MTAHLGVFDGRSVTYALKAEPTEGMVKFDTYPGKAASLHLTAIGRAIATALPERDLQRLLRRYEFSNGHNSRIRSRASFLAELEMIRNQGYAFEDEEEALGVSCVAAPLRDADTDTGGAAAVGITALSPQIREATIEDVSQRVVAAAEALSVLLGAGGGH